MEKASHKIRNLNAAKALVDQWKRLGEKVVFTNGCFDVLHLGHVDYLEKAKALGHRLVVGLNTDESVSRIKGPSRPVQDQHSRARILAALGFVDLVVFFNDPTPLDLISELLPDILVKGSDYLAGDIVGADVVQRHGGRVLSIDLTPGYSSSKIIEKIKTT